jgi:hypothetical protein
MQSVVLITTCTGRKRVRPKDDVHFRHMRGRDIQAAARDWVERIASVDCATTANELYSGRGFAEAKRAAALLGAPLKIVSAGLGLIDSDRPVPAYEATISPGSPDSICSHLGIQPQIWWAALKEQLQFKWPPDDKLLLIAASGPYLEMIEQDLLRLRIERLRLFTRTRISELPKALRSAVMPYDGRLDAECARPGTIADFAQRALAHFVEHVLPYSLMGSTDDHAALVRSSLNSLEAPVRRTGRGATDEEIKSIIRAHYESVGGRSSLMLRKLRDEIGVACEQSRFKVLFKAVARDQEEMACLPL